MHTLPFTSRCNWTLGARDSRIDALTSLQRDMHEELGIHQGPRVHEGIERTAVLTIATHLCYKEPAGDTDMRDGAIAYKVSVWAEEKGTTKPNTDKTTDKRCRILQSRAALFRGTKRRGMQPNTGSK